MAVFRLRKIDSGTGCFTAQIDFETDDLSKIIGILKVEDLVADTSYDLSSGEMDEIVREFDVGLEGPFEGGEIYFRSRPRNYHDDGHTGRELLLMLQGKKPFATFVDSVPTDGDYMIPDRFFAPYVESGLIVRREVLDSFLTGDNKNGSIRRVMFAIQGQEWRFDAYLMLWELAGKYGWSIGLEKCEGYLLGYETDLLDHVSPFAESKITRP